MKRYQRLFIEETPEDLEIKNKERVKVLRDTVDKLEFKNKQIKIDLDYIDVTDAKGREKRDMLKLTLKSNKETIRKLKQDIEDLKNPEEK